jgi:hypothetical protein
LDNILTECDEAYQNWVKDFMQKQYKTNDLCDLPSDIFPRIRTAALKNMEKYHARQRQAHLEIPVVEVPNE